MAGKRFLGKLTSTLSSYPVGQKFHLNRSISHRYRDKCVFVFYAEIQDRRQKWQENNFWLKSPVDSADTLRAKNCRNCSISHHYQNKCVLGRNSR